jgi:DnaK suppressor protein
VGRRDELRRRLGGDLKDLLQQGSMTGDAADQAFDSGSEEVSSQLAELESRELLQIERAIAKLKQGSYGVCEGCVRKIPVTRLNVLPYSVMCIECQREMEMYGSLGHRANQVNWDKVSERDHEEREVNLSDLELDISSSR